MYHIKIDGVPDYSGLDVQPYALPTEDEAFKFALGIIRHAMSGGRINLSNLTISIIGPSGFSKTWSLREFLLEAYLYREGVNLFARSR
jgi:hypothetical protein